MAGHPKQRGRHTWDLTVHYHRCPECGYIFESRDKYFYRLGTYIKELQCCRCHNHFTIRQNAGLRVGPFFGEGAPAEVEWK